MASEEIRQTHQSVVEDLYGEIEEKELRISSLQREIEDLRSEFRQRAQSLEMELRRRDREVQDLREHAERLRFYSSGNSPRAALDIPISVTSHAFHFDLTIETHNIMGRFLY